MAPGLFHWGPLRAGLRLEGSARTASPFHRLFLHPLSVDAIIEVAFCCPGNPSSEGQQKSTHHHRMHTAWA